MAQIQIDVPRDEIADFCARNHIQRMSLFGSATRDDFGPESDIDVLVEFEPGQTPGFAFFAMQDELSTMLGGPVELHTPGFLSRYFRDEVMAQVVTLYE